MNDKDISILLKKADELRSLFVLGQRVIPFLEEIFVFVSEIQPLLDDINVSIEENLKKMPNASKQLSKVTEATEMATTEIMDIVDGVVNKTTLIGENLEKIRKNQYNKIDEAIKLLNIVKKGIEEDSKIQEALPELNTAINHLKEEKEINTKEVFDNTNDIVQSISMDSSSIMMSLQVQDITSQQIAAVNNLLEKVQNKLGNILSRFNKTDIGELVDESKKSASKQMNVSKMHRDIAFDPDAVDSISMKHERQSKVDSYMEDAANNNDEDDFEPKSQDDIDALFDSNNNEDAEEKNSDDTETSNQDDIDKMFDNTSQDEDDNNEETSQDDIDALFESNNNEDAEENNTDKTETEEDNSDDINDEISQDDIDKMFNS